MRKAVIIDDEKLSVELIKFLIHSHDIPVEVVGEAYSGDDGLELIEMLKPDVVFMDINMPVLNGLDVMKKINEMQKIQIDFIIITAYDYFEYAQAALRLGAKDILLKPIEPEMFVEATERVLCFKKSYSMFFNEILEYVNLNYNQDIKLKKCAEKYHTSSSYIDRMFKKFCSISFTSYVNDLRVKNAMRLLKETDLTIKEISFKVGYNNLNYFYRTFKKSTGTTPNKFKEKNASL